MLVPNNKVDTINSKKDSGIWGPWPTVGFGVAIFAVYVIVQSIAIVIFAVVSLVSDPTLSILQLAQNISNNGLAIAISIYPSTIVGVGLIFVFIRARTGVNIREYLGIKSITKKTTLVLLSIPPLLIVLLELVSALFKSSSSQFMIDIYRTSIWPVFLWLAVVIFAPIFEETFFRGFLFVGLKQSRIGSVGTIALTTLLWALLHVQYDVYTMSTIVVLGVILGIVRLKSDSLWSPLLIHSFWNLLAMVQTALYLNGIIS